MSIRLSICPPSPVVEGTPLDLRIAVGDESALAGIVVEREDADGREAVPVSGGAALGPGRELRLTTVAGREGPLRITARTIGDEGAPATAFATIEVRPADAPRTLGGAWVDLYHHSEPEGVPFNEDLRRLDDADWAELVDAMHEVGQDVIVVSAVFHHYFHRGEHRATADDYPGHALYPSQVYPRRWPIASHDAIEAILARADERGMKVFLGVGTFAFFDYTAECLEWCRRVAGELWERYGAHDSLYGWYVSHEQGGGLHIPGLGGLEEQQTEMIEFFERFTRFVRGFAPEKFVMLATNPFGMVGHDEAYRRLLPNIDILAPFGFHRMPTGDLDEAQAIAHLRALCAEAGTHLWADLESFHWPLVNGAELRPRAVAEIVSDLERFRSFEKILHYQFPGLMTGPRMRVPLGGPEARRLYDEYAAYLANLDG